MAETDLPHASEAFFARDVSPPYLFEVEEGVQGRQWVGPAPRLATDDGFASYAEVGFGAAGSGWDVDRFAGVNLAALSAPGDAQRLQFRLRARWTNPSSLPNMGLWLGSASGSFLHIASASGTYDGDWFAGFYELNVFGGGTTWADALSVLAAGDLIVAAQMASTTLDSDGQLTQIRVTLVTAGDLEPSVFPLRQKQRNDGLARGVYRARSTSSIQNSVRQNSYR